MQVEAMEVVIGILTQGVAGPLCEEVVGGLGGGRYLGGDR